VSAASFLAAAGDPPWRLDDREPPPVSYRVDPSLLENLLLAAAIVLALVGVVLFALAVRSALASRARRRLTPLELALRAARAARDAAARRRALGALARVVGAGSFARRAEAVAWAPPPPSPEQVEAFARAAEQEAVR
jgi:type II secretory pathway pseudopilin PulG